MSSTVDANVLVYASNASDPVSLRARTLVERLATGPDLVYLFWPTIMGYIRIVTHPSLLPRPLSFRDATENISALLRLPHVRTAAEIETSESTRASRRAIHSCESESSGRGSAYLDANGADTSQT